jgi:hypothetical protein
MNLLIVVVRDVTRLDDFLSALVKLDVAGLEVIESASSIGFLAREVPIFAGLRQLVTRPEATSRTLFGLTARDDILDALSKQLKRVGIDLNATDAGYATVVPATGWTGRLDPDEA